MGRSLLEDLRQAKPSLRFADVEEWPHFHCGSRGERRELSNGAEHERIGDDDGASRARKPVAEARECLRHTLGFVGRGRRHDAREVDELRHRRPQQRIERQSLEESDSRRGADPACHLDANDAADDVDDVGDGHSSGDLFRAT